MARLGNQVEEEDVDDDEHVKDVPVLKKRKKTNSSGNYFNLQRGSKLRTGKDHSVSRK